MFRLIDKETGQEKATAATWHEAANVQTYLQNKWRRALLIERSN